MDDSTSTGAEQIDRAVGRARPLPVTRSTARCVLASGEATTVAGVEDALIADARDGLTPSQMVDRQLLARLGYGHPGLFLQASGRPGEVRRLPRE
jgi:hypothetical protein